MYVCIILGGKHMRYEIHELSPHGKRVSILGTVEAPDEQTMHLEVARRWGVRSVVAIRVDLPASD